MENATTSINSPVPVILTGALMFVIFFAILFTFATAAKIPISYCDRTYGVDGWHWELVKCGLSCEYKCVNNTYAVIE